MNALRTAHRFLQSHTFYPLAISSAITLLFLIGRVIHTHSPAYIFLSWNLTLAWVPYIFSLLAAQLHQWKRACWWALLPYAALWMLFFPNAPYILTDLLHLWNIPPAIWWYDIGMVAAFAWSGCFLAVASLQIMQQIVRSYLGQLAGWAFALLALGLSGLGVYLGRVVRFNSWDLFLSPRTVLRTTLESVIHPMSQLQAVGMSAMFAAILLMCYLTFTAHQPAPQRSS